MNDDFISRQAAIKTALTFFVEYLGGAFHEDMQAILRKRFEEAPSAEEESFEWCTDCKEYDQEAHCCHRWTKVIRNTVDEFKNEHRWIPVSEKLPDDGRTVLVTDWGETDFGKRHDGRWWNCDGDVLKDVSAWMQLPEPYKDGEQNG